VEEQSKTTQKMPRYWETHLYGYAYFCRDREGISDESRAKMKAKCLMHGHTEEKNPELFIRTGRMEV
jgi:hypothetical protein